MNVFPHCLVLNLGWRGSLACGARLGWSQAWITSPCYSGRQRGRSIEFGGAEVTAEWLPFVEQNSRTSSAHKLGSAYGVPPLHTVTLPFNWASLPAHRHKELLLPLKA